jgi:hypothetical protein
MRRNSHVGVVHHFTQRLRRDGAGLARRGHDHLLRVREQDTANFGDGLVAHGPVDQAHAPGAVEPVDIGGQRAGRGWIVRAVEDDLGALGDPLQATRPACAGDA